MLVDAFWARRVFCLAVVHRRLLEDRHVNAPLPHPDDESLAKSLGEALGEVASSFSILQRHPNPHTSTFRSEIITCMARGSERLRLFCKYGTGPGHVAHGSRGGVAYEAEVYRRILSGAALPVPGFYG